MSIILALTEGTIGKNSKIITFLSKHLKMWKRFIEIMHDLIEI